MLESYEEHHVADVLVLELSTMKPDNERFTAKTTVLIENVEHHMEEEEGEMFKQARAVFDRSELEDLGERMEARRASAKQELGVPA